MVDKNSQESFSISSSSSIPGEGNESSARLPWNYSPPTLAVEGAEEYQSSHSFEVQLTVRSRFKLTQKQLQMLSGIALSDVAESGMSLSDWIILEFLYSQILGSKQDYFEKKDSKEFELTLLLKVVLLSGTWMGLEDKREIPEDIQKLILSSRWVPKGRVKSSWRPLWQLNKFIEIRAVPLDALFERKKGTIRYSSYCKGYGESSHMGRRQKTRPSAELDGEQVDLEKEKAVKLNLNQISTVLQGVLLEIKYSNRSK